MGACSGVRLIPITSNPALKRDAAKARRPLALRWAITEKGKLV